MLTVLLAHRQDFRHVAYLHDLFYDWEREGKGFARACLGPPYEVPAAHGWVKDVLLDGEQAFHAPPVHCCDRCLRESAILNLQKPDIHSKTITNNSTELGLYVRSEHVCFAGV